jgi:hypothetical protein
VSQDVRDEPEAMQPTGSCRDEVVLEAIDVTKTYILDEQREPAGLCG